MIRRLFLCSIALVVFGLAGCQAPQEFGPNATDSDLWEIHDIRIDTEVPNQYPNGRSGLAGAGVLGDGVTADPEDDAH